MPQLWIIAGPNGAGKTTVADRWFAPRIPVVSPDTIAVQSGIGPIRAGRMAVFEQERLLAAGASFALDTTLSGKRERVLMKRATDAGYKVNLVFICVESLSLCQARILERTESGGHAVPFADVARRYGRSLANLPAALVLAERVFVLDNTGERRRLLLSVEQGRIKHLSGNLPVWAKAVVSSSCREIGATMEHGAS